MRVSLFFFGLLCALPLHAEPTPVGFVKTVKGDAWVISGADTVSAKAGVAVFQGSVLKTGPASSLGVTFRDDTVMSFGPQTELTVDEYLYAPSQGQLRLASRLARGSMNYLSGVIAKLRPEAVTVTTPSGMIGIRGTHFVVKVEEE